MVGEGRPVMVVITAHARRGRRLNQDETAAYIAELQRLAPQRLSLRLLAERLNLSKDQVRSLCAKAGVDTSSPTVTRPTGRPAKELPPKPKVEKSAPAARQKKPTAPRPAPVRIVHTRCRWCRVPEVPLARSGRFDEHYRLGPSRRGVAIAVLCEGSGRYPIPDQEGL
jgi:hypothetical protein